MLEKTEWVCCNCLKKHASCQQIHKGQEVTSERLEDSPSCAWVCGQGQGPVLKNAAHRQGRGPLLQSQMRFSNAPSSAEHFWGQEAHQLDATLYRRPTLSMAVPTLRDRKWKQVQSVCTWNLARPGGMPRSNLPVEVASCGFGHIARKIRNFRNSALPVGNRVPHNGPFMEPWPTVGTVVLF